MKSFAQTIAPLLAGVAVSALLWCVIRLSRYCPRPTLRRLVRSWRAVKAVSL